MRKERLIALVISLMMVFSLIPASVFAAEVDENSSSQQNMYLSEGWNVDYEGNYHYCLDGNEIKGGLFVIGESTYCFDENGILVVGEGELEVSGNIYYFELDSDDSTKAHIKTGIIDKHYYGPAKRTETGFFTYENKTFYTKKGVLQTGWKSINDKAYYFYKSGSKKYEQAKNTKIGYLKIPSSGYLGKSYSQGIKVLNKNGWSLSKAYQNSYKLKYAKRSMRRSTAEQYATYGFTNKAGNCYVMASTFYIQAKLLGYNVRQIEGKVNYYYPHSWTQIKHGEKWYVYDPNFKNETGRNGWKFRYGKKGTWRYMKYHVFQR